MIFQLKLDGSMVAISNETVYQGSNNVNKIYVVAPYKAPVTLSIAFTLPDGTTTAVSLMTYRGVLADVETPINLNNIPSAYTDQFTLWEYALPFAVTQYDGTVGVSVIAAVTTTAFTGTINSYSTTFTVSYSALPSAPTDPETATWDTIYNLLSTGYTTCLANIGTMTNLGNTQSTEPTVANRTLVNWINYVNTKANTNASDIDDLEDEIDEVRDSIGNGTLTIQKNGTTVASFGANSSTNVTANLSIPTVINNTTSTDTSNALSAAMGKYLQDKIDTLEGRGKFLSMWNCVTGKPVTDPTVLPYTYNTGDYYIVSVVGTTNYKPSGTSYTGAASTTLAESDVNVDATYYFDGTSWSLQLNNQVVQTTGTSTTKVMSQKAVTDLLDKVIEPLTTKDLIAQNGKEKGTDGTAYNYAIKDGQMLVNKVEGQSYVFNQLLPIQTSSGTTVDGITYTNNNDGSWTLNGTSTGNASYQMGQFPLVNGHKYVFKTGNADVIIMNGSWTFQSSETNVLTYSGSTATVNLVIRVSGSGKTFSNTKVYLQLHDLTTMPLSITSVSDFKAIFPLTYYSYTTGTLINSNNKLVGIGRNLWDEEWRNGYYSTRGVFVSDTNEIATKNKIKIPSNASSLYFSSGSGNFGRICWYDASENFISTNVLQTKNTTWAIPSNAYYLTFDMVSGYGTIYNNDICINISNTDFNGTYEPYVKNTASWNGTLKHAMSENGVDLGTLTYTKLADGWFRTTIDTMANGNSDNTKLSNIICSAYTNDTYYNVYNGTNNKTIAVANGLKYLNIRDSAYTDATTFKNALSGVILYYELATPTYETITDQESIELKGVGTAKDTLVNNGGLSVYNGGIQIQENASTTIQVPYTLTKEYAISVSGQLANNMAVDASQQESIQRLANKVDSVSDISVEQDEISVESGKEGGGNYAILDESQMLVTSVKGQSYVFNNIANNGDMASTTNYVASNGTISVANNILTFVGNNDTNNKSITYTYLNANDLLVSGHKYYITFESISNYAFNTQTLVGGSQSVSASTTYQKNEFVQTWNGSASYKQQYFYNYNGVSDWTLKLRNYRIVDLTAIGYASVSSVSDLPSWYRETLLPYSATNQLISSNNELRSTNADGTISNKISWNGTLTNALYKVKLKDLTYSIASQGYFYATLTNGKLESASNIANILSNLYEAKSFNYVSDTSSANSIALLGVSSTCRVCIRDSSYTDATTFKNHFTDDDVIIYELATPTTETIVNATNVELKGIGTVQDTLSNDSGLVAYKSGYQYQDNANGVATIPYTMEKTYSVALVEQMQNNCDIDKAQQKEIQALKVSQLFENIVDKNGNKRFQEGSYSSSSVIPTGLTLEYGRWSLSGTHIMFVGSFSLAVNTTLSAESLSLNFVVPTWIYNKIYPYSGYVRVDAKNVQVFQGGLYTYVDKMFTMKKENNLIELVNVDSITTQAVSYRFRVQFDLIIDND